MTFDLDIWRGERPYLGHVRRSRSYVKVQRHRKKNVPCVAESETVKLGKLHSTAWMKSRPELETATK